MGRRYSKHYSFLSSEEEEEEEGVKKRSPLPSYFPKYAKSLGRKKESRKGGRLRWSAPFKSSPVIPFFLFPSFSFPPQICSTAYFHGLKKNGKFVCCLFAEMDILGFEPTDRTGKVKSPLQVRFDLVSTPNLCVSVSFFLTFIFVRSPRVYFWEL